MLDDDFISIFPAKHFMTNDDILKRATDGIRLEMEEQVKKFEQQGKLLEAQRIKQRTEYDIEMLLEMGYTNGIENYSRWMDGRKQGEPPLPCLISFLKISCWSSTRAMSRCLRYGGCITVIVPVSRL
ncbi:hypothetical protein Q757_08555 [Oenococcus alcoholitolerans]|uniref:Uncharacterized protein n=1 Tax=Oenococcus alcoholitolerans TaxID=931074 RepID=A0ABR4XP50_9LACO|nr:hypothetical protein Q757_08555 [Oenococcus alcoholitolerans]